MKPHLLESRGVRHGALRRAVASFVTATLLLQTVAPAFAEVSQLPGIYIAPPDANVMFTLDDSLSMMSDTITDLDDDNGAPANALNSAGVPNNANSNYYWSNFGRTFPDMWGRNSNTDSSYLTAALNDISNKAARYLRSAAGNPLYYDPTVTYVPWPQAGTNSSPSANASMTAVNIHPTNPFDTGSDSRRINLTVRFNNSFWPAVYFVYVGTSPLPLAKPNDALNVAANFRRFEIQGPLSVQTFDRATTRTDCGGAFLPATGGCTSGQELQNFANWLQYYRSRMLMAKGGTARAFAQQGTALRVGFATLNSSPIVREAVSGFSGTSRTDFFNDLYSIPFSTQGTPLRQAMDAVGKYFQRSGAGSPWYDSTKTPNEFSCRKAFHILSTDGFWNNGVYTSAFSIGNTDNFAPSNPTYTPYRSDNVTRYVYGDNVTANPSDPLTGRYTVNPFKDSVSNTLADVAGFYWKTDLRPDLANDVFPSDRDPAFWQHLTTFTVGLGIYGTGNVKARSTPDDPAGTTTDISTEANRAKLIKNRTVLPWPTPAEASPETGDDLIHAAMNGRGRYFSATNPTELSASLASALAEATDRPTSLAAVATNTSSLSANSVVYLSTFSADQWYGRLYAFSQDPATGSVNTLPIAPDRPNATQLWEASHKMPAPVDRKIYTYNPLLGGSLFTAAGLSALQLAALGTDTTIIDYLRGSEVRELANGGPFRDRNRYTVNGVKGGVLGDVVNGSPIKGGDFGFNYERLTAGAAQASYLTYRNGSTLDTFRKTLFLGANDGMLHAFNIDDGVERFAYVPNSVFSVQATPLPAAPLLKLKALADVAYTHRFTVDGPPQLADAYLSGSWKALLMGSTGAGARSVFAMNVTNPSPSAGFDPSKVLWEFSDTVTAGRGSADMGYMLSYPHAALMKNGQWAAIVGNGYDNRNDVAKLFIINLETGVLIKEIAVGTATTAGADPTGINGLSQPNFVLNSSRQVETIYAGDLKGNLWKFDVSSTDPANWKLAFAGTPTEPLFTARNASGQAQPIAVMPEITAHPNGGVLVSFGTGKLFETEDTAQGSSNVNLNLQSLYGIWDKPLETRGISTARNVALQAQTAPTSFNGTTFLGASSNNTVDWLTKRGWYIDLASGGERSNIIPQQINQVLVMIANTPNVNPCGSGGTSKVFILDPVTGGPPKFAPFATVGNVYSEAGGLLSFPIFQATGSTAGSRPYRGATGVRAGGVDPTAATNVSCDQLFVAGKSDPVALSLFLQTCVPGKPRISWRQLL